MVLPRVYPWQRAPFIRLLPPFVAGILLQWHLQPTVFIPIAFSAAAAAFLLCYTFFNLRYRFRLTLWAGISIHLLLGGTGALLTYQKNRNNTIDPITNDPLCVRVLEPLQEKRSSWKALAETVEKRKVILYLQKDSSTAYPSYGAYVIFRKVLQPIARSGNPGSFDYREYCRLKGITAQVYLARGEWLQLPEKKTATLPALVFRSREATLRYLQKIIPGEKERGLAEALLIGYRDDLDRELVQAYANTGVVHVIAISGLHIGLIYSILLLLTRPLDRKGLRWARLLLVLSALWLFSLLAGAQPSVLRSALMFTVLAAGTVLERKANIYNSLALSAFLLLLLDPFTLWDIGFQLSYAAVASILLFYRHLAYSFFLSNKIIQGLWQLCAVTLSAQVLTTPLCLYHFHQFPVLFLLANLVAVPLSSALLLAEIVLFAFAPFPTLAAWGGRVLATGIRWMNLYIERLDSVSFATWEGILLSPLQAVWLTLFLACTCYWLLQSHKARLYAALLFLLLFTVHRSYSFWQQGQQSLLIVHQLPSLSTVSLVQGRKETCITGRDAEPSTINYHLRPSRTMLRIHHTQEGKAGSYRLKAKHILIADRPFVSRDTIHFLLLSSAAAPLPGHNTLLVGQVITDGTVPRWKEKRWKEYCHKAGIRYHSVKELGAFVVNL